MRSKKEEKIERELRLKAQMKENLFKRKKLMKLKSSFNQNLSVSPIKGKEPSNG